MFLGLVQRYSGFMRNYFLRSWGWLRDILVVHSTDEELFLAVLGLVQGDCGGSAFILKW